MLEKPLSDMICSDEKFFGMKERILQVLSDNGTFPLLKLGAEP